MRVMGMNPMKIRDFREYLRVLRTLLQGEEVEYTFNDTTRTIRFLHQDLKFIDLEHPIPIIVAANGPLALKAAGEFGDGLISVLNEQEAVLNLNMDYVGQGAARVGRDLSDYHTVSLTSVVVLEPGEDLTSERVIDECGSWVSAVLHFAYEIYEFTGNEEMIPPSVHDIWDEYCAYVKKMETPAEKRYLQIHNGHCTFLMPEERRFITPKAIEGSCIVGTPDEILDKLRAAEKNGLKEVSLLPPMASARKVLTDFKDKVMKHY